VIALGLLLAKVNPYIVYSSEYSVWRYVVHFLLKYPKLMSMQYDALSLVCRHLVLS
jgi:hypothetical protein